MRATEIDKLKRSLPKRRAIVALEAIVWLPILLIVLFSIVEMGLMLVGVMHASMASRIAAREASIVPGLASASTSQVADDLRETVDLYFENAGYGPNASRGLRLQHTAGAGGSSASGECEEENDPPLPNIVSGAPRSVRVVVCIPAEVVSPNCLAQFGFDLSNCWIHGVTTFPYLGEVP
ncbi:TadE family protein [Thalassoglobus sp. JC818]|uniref:TadE/TadG family type IV pilus assembly protein n=1 Tax=Thalassoglobus sp. JC818 TaxID=3232136 RepID=UPI00345823A6